MQTEFVKSLSEAGGSVEHRVRVGSAMDWGKGLLSFKPSDLRAQHFQVRGSGEGKGRQGNSLVVGPGLGFGVVELQPEFIRSSLSLSLSQMRFAAHKCH